MSSKSISKNAFYNVIYKCLNVLFPLITIMYVSRVLMPEGVGIVASSQNIVAYFVIIASLGLPVYGVKKIAEYRDDRKKCSQFNIKKIKVVCTVIISRNLREGERGDYSLIAIL